MANPAWSILWLWWLPRRACAQRAGVLQLASRLYSLSRYERYEGRITRRVWSHINHAVTHVRVYSRDRSSHPHILMTTAALIHSTLVEVKTRQNIVAHLFFFSFCWQITFDNISAVSDFVGPLQRFFLPPSSASSYFSSLSHVQSLLWGSPWQCSHTSRRGVFISTRSAHSALGINVMICMDITPPTHGRKQTLIGSEREVSPCLLSLQGQEATGTITTQNRWRQCWRCLT